MNRRVPLLFVLTILFFSHLSAFSTNDSLFVQHKQCIKMRIVEPVIALALMNYKGNKFIGFAYERVLARKRSFNISVDFQRLYKLSYSTAAVSQSNGVSIYPEYRFYPFNRKQSTPRGFFISPSVNVGAYFGWNRMYANRSISVNYYMVNYSNPLSVESRFRAISIGAGGALGWEYFIGKRKRINFSFLIAMYANKNVILYESVPVYDGYRMYPRKNSDPTGTICTYIGYTFCEVKNK